MDVVLVWCKKEAHCSACKGEIPAGTTMVRGKVWRGGKNSTTLQFRWHPECWVKQGSSLLPEYKPAKDMGLTDDEKLRRDRILREWAKTRWLIRQEVDKEVLNLEVLQKLARKASGLTRKIEPIGGIPKSWFESIDLAQTEEDAVALIEKEITDGRQVGQD